MLLIVGLYVVYSRVVDVGVWTYVTAVVASAPVLMEPIAAGVAAWAGGRGVRRGVEHGNRLAARGAMAGALSTVAALTAWTMLAYVGVVGVVFTICATRATWGSPSWLWIFTAATGLVASVSIGFLCGRLMSWRLAPLAVTFVVFLINVFLGNSEEWPSLLAPAAARIWVPFEYVLTVTLLAQLGWYIGLILLAFGILSAVLRASRWLVTAMLIMAMAALLIGGSTARSQGPAFTALRPPIWVCDGTAPQVCVHPAFSFAFDRVSAGARAVAARLAGTPFEITRVEQRLRGAGQPSPGAIPYGLDADKPEHLRQAMREMAAGALNYPNSCLPATGRPLPGQRLALLVVLWASGGLEEFVVFPGEQVAVDWLASSSSAALRTWLVANADAIRNCTLLATDFR